jgi:hypothetical protein
MRSLRPEEFKIVDGFERYLIGNFGSVVSTFKGSRFLTWVFDGAGYPMVSLTSRNRNTKTVRVHKLVAKAFVANPENFSSVKHINGIRHDNHFENLKWFRYFSEDDVDEIKRLHASGIRQLIIAEKFNCTPSAISCVITGKRDRCRP